MGIGGVGSEGAATAKRRAGGGGLLPLDRTYAACLLLFWSPPPHKPYFNPSQIAAITAYVKCPRCRARDTGAWDPLMVTPACANETSKCPTMSEGNELFLLNCAQCHDASGAGGMLSHGYVGLPSLRQATPAQIAEAIRVGTTTHAQLRARASSPTSRCPTIADYVYYLSHTPRPRWPGDPPTSVPSPRASWASSLGSACFFLSPA